ncbi:hypothetical protein [Apilactobacillus quenuiae]|uniref:hypothetical protein n=1 Tax=Apilactobacillus quenuiae TaxID=2008377 RepID=UPI0012FFE8CD|nr:hypothetical protein [Apilactobacillus quenuiae]
MIITILMTIFTIILLIIGLYLYKHRNKPFMLLRPENNQLLSSMVKYYGIIFIGLSIMSLISVIINIMYFIITILIISCIMSLVMELTLIKFLPQK